jgi:hypothetical protein
LITNTQKDIKVTPYRFTKLLRVKITQEVNEHATVNIYGMIDDSFQDDYVFDTNFGDQVNVVQTLNGAEVILFKGMVTDIKIKHIHSTYYAEIEGVSNSYLFDIRLRSRSFQDITATYESIFDTVAKGKEYKSGSIYDKATKKAITEKYIIQYRETDFQFVKRLASRFNAGLVPDIKSNDPQFYVGHPTINCTRNLDEFNYSVRKRIKDHAVSSQNTNPELTPLDRVEYTIESNEYLELCEPVKYKNILLYVRKSQQEIKEDIITNTYILTTLKGLSQDEVFNDSIRGLSLQARVLERVNNKVKTHIFQIDEKQDVGKAYEFEYTTSYTASGNSGLYCMPELDDTVYIYHPSNRDESAVSLNSIRTQYSESDKITDPDTKYWRTRAGREIKLDPKEILITTKDDEIYFRINEETGVEIHSTKPINIKTAQDLNLTASKGIKVLAKTEITYECKGSKIQMDGEILIEGKKIKNNS